MSIPLNAGRDNALEYAQRGWATFPVARNAKNPWSLNGQNDATTDEAKIRYAFGDKGMANVGIHCRPSGLYVVDVDMNPWKGKVGQATWDALIAEHGHADTYTVRSWSGGLHLYYSYDGGDLTNTAGKLGPDVDTRGNGYVLAAPSFVREDGHEGTYEVVNDVPLASLPQWIIDIVRKPEPVARISGGVAAPTTDVERRVHELAAELVATPKGSRNPQAAALAFKAGQYVGAGQISKESVVQIFLGAITAWGRFHTVEGERTMSNTISNQVDAGAGHPREWEKPIARTTLVAVADDGTVPEAETEIGHGQYRMAQRMLREHGEDVRYSSALGWYTYDETRWVPDEDGSTLRRGQATIDNAYRAVPDQDGSDARKELIRDIGKAESASGMAGTLEHLGAMLPVAVGRDPFDKTASLFNTPQNTVDLASGGQREHRREDLVSKVAGAEIGTERSEVFEKFLERILPDLEVRSYVQRLFGQAMLGRVTEHVLPIFTGVGRNGKGTLRDAVLHAFGGYALEVDPEILMEQKNARHATFLLELLGRRLVFCSEGEKSRRFAEATMKRLVGGDPIQANRMHRDPITFDPSHTLILLTNHLPQVSGDDAAVWARIQVVPFDVVIPVDERDGNLPEKLKAEAPAVLRWVYEGWLAYQAQGLNPPEAVKASTQAYQDDSDVLGRFLEENTIPNKTTTIRAGEFHSAYTKWCHDQGEVAETGVMFAKSLKARGFTKKKTNQGAQYEGLMMVGEYA
jgi:putative DNA primase/helicase